jgi:hypothetical protein
MRLPLRLKGAMFPASFFNLESMVIIARLGNVPERRPLYIAILSFQTLASAFTSFTAGL